MMRWQEPFHMCDALNMLYSKDVRDLTSEGYHQAMRRLRREDPASAGRVERILAPHLKKNVFTRRQKEWHEMSEGARARLALLPGNPHVQIDMHTIREVLQIPLGHIQASEGDALWKQLEALVRRGRVRRLVEGNLAAHWLHIHREAASGRLMETEDSEMLCCEIRQSAVISAGVDLRSSDVPEWLQPPLVDSGVYRDLSAPLDQAAHRLAERHKLPRRTVLPLAVYILTQDPSWITGLDSLDVDVSYGDDPSGDPCAFRLSLKGIDEFITKEDWDRVWTDYVRPRQKLLWERRGMSPQGRRTIDIGRLQDALPGYQKIVREGWKIGDLFNQPVAKLVDWDQETIRRAISDLKQLLHPER